MRVAILDVLMPGQTGILLQEQLQHLSPETKVIIITGGDEPTIRTLALNGGACAFLTKPLDDEAFLVTVRGALGE